MDCLTYRRMKLAAPQDTSAAVVAHMRECGECAAFTGQLEAFEQDLHRAANIAVPDGLAEQIILRQRTPRWHDKRSILAVAATLMLSASAFLGYDVISDRSELAVDFIAHVAAEPETLSAQGSVEPARFDQALAGYGAVLDGPIGEIRYLGDCVVEGRLTRHILVQTQYGPATLLLFPQRHASVSKPVLRDGFAAVIVKLANGSMGIITESPDLAMRVETLIMNRMRVRS